jgi:hypothetical protein
MHVGARGLLEALEKVFDELRLEAADASRREFRFHYAKGASTEIDGRGSQSFVHGHQKITGAENAAPVSESSVDGFPESDADIFDGVMLIDVKIAGGLKAKVEGAMTRYQVEHVVKKLNASGNFGFAAAIEI